MSEDTSTHSGAPTTQPESLRRSDRRYDLSGLRDWIILAVMVLLYALFAFSLYLLEPGIR